MASPAAGAAGLDDYFKEGEQKSLEEDYAPKKDSAPPPPPKLGGPPRAPPKTTSPAPGEGESTEA